MIERRGRDALSFAQGRSVEFDEGLRRYMLRVYGYMALALCMTGLTAFGVSQSQGLVSVVYGTPLKWVVMLAPLGLVFFLSARIHNMKPSTAQAVFWGYAVLMGVSLSYIFLAYAGASVARVFFIAAGAFGALSLYGYTTRRDLGPVGAALMVGLVGIIIASVVNVFLESSGLHFAVSCIGVLVFAGLTARDTQRIKLMYAEGVSFEDGERKAILGALTLYLDFINLFIMLLQLLGNRE